MNKQEFIALLTSKLAALPQSEIYKSVAYFSEIIDDRVEDGMTEQQAVASLENIDEIVEKIMLETPLPVLVKSRMKPIGSLSTLSIVLIILGFPVWFPLLMAAVAIFFSFYVSVWAIIVSLYSVVFALTVSGLAAVVTSPLFLAAGRPLGLLNLGGGLLCLGLGILLFFPITELSKMLVKLTARFLRKIKSLFIQKEVA